MGVSVVAPGNAWAVGDFANKSGGPRFALVEHLADGHWVRATIPRLGIGSSLLGVSGDAPDDVWAVGIAGGDLALLLHWDGHHWQRYHGPGPAHKVIASVTTHGSTSTFAVGASFGTRTRTPVQERWNGHVWTR